MLDQCLHAWHAIYSFGVDEDDWTAPNAPFEASLNVRIDARRVAPFVQRFREGGLVQTEPAGMRNQVLLT